ncbi:ATP-binding protein [Mycoplasma leonicaptivi]|uniref:ATP-binding protein n=1 Tax=Mycoplasma leonicaptivi TaxID=36742 RepID=UPI0004811F0C|nr:ATP-binding protein [Mycoplasma leonicaptivi]
MGLLNCIGETTYCEKKIQVEIKRPKSWLKSISAFANTNGGKLIFGIDDNDNLVGLINAKKDCEFISEIIKAKLEPVPNFSLDIIQENNKEFIILNVNKGQQTPYYLIDSGSKLAYTRIGNESALVNSWQLKNLVLQGFNQTFDTLNTNTQLDKVSFSKLKSVYFYTTLREFEDNDLLSFALIDANNYLTNAGLLFADEGWLLQSRIFATRWNGLDKTHERIEAIDDKEYRGSLLYLLQSGQDFIKNNSKIMWKKGKEYRIEYPDYPEKAVKEALVNAIIHRDYTQIGSEIHIDMFDDRLEIYSPGGMVDGSLIQNQDPYKIASKRRNPIIADVFARMNLMERRGSGLKKILQTYQMQANYDDSLKPIFSSTSSSFYITLKNLNYKNIDNIENNIDKNIDINPKQEILKFAKINGIFKSSQLIDVLDLKPARIRQILQFLVKNDYLETIGQNKNRRYKLK